MAYLDVQGTRLYHEDSGGSAAALLMIHGASADTLAWQDNIPHFAGRWRVLALDLPGHGKSATIEGRPTRTTDEFAACIAGFLEALDLQDVVLVGHSMGAAISITTAVHHPARIRGVVAVDGGAAFSGSAGVGYRGELLQYVAVNPSAWLETTFHSVLGRTTSERRRREMAFDATRCSPYVAYADLLTYTSFDFARIMPRLALPVHYIVGEDDWSTTPQMTRDTSAQLATLGIATSVTELPGVGHIPHWEQPDVFNRALEDVLARLAR